MPKVKTYPWDPADHIETAEDAILFLKVSLEDYDFTFGALMDCIARSKGVSQIDNVTLNDADPERRSVTVTTTAGASTTIPIAPNVNADAILKALAPQTQADAASPRPGVAKARA